jgi:amino-acid N-acetyltransferase
MSAASSAGTLEDHRPSGGVLSARRPPVRPARPADAPRIAELVNGFAARGDMLPRTTEEVLRHFREFTVAIDAAGRVIGCAGLRLYTPQLAEVVALAVEEDAQGAGAGRRLVRAMEREARRLGVGTLFALTRCEGFFHRLGYRTVPRELFPLKMERDCARCPRAERCDEVAVEKEL